MAVQTAADVASRTSGDDGSRGRARAAGAGVVAALAAIGTAELLAGAVDTIPSLVVVIGQAFIRVVPETVARAAIDVFGTADKPVLLIGITVTAAAVGAVLGLLARARPGPAAVGFAAFGLLAVLAAATLTGVSTAGAAAAAVVAVLVGFGVGSALLRAAAAPNGSAGRRTFLRLAAGALLGGGLAAMTGRWLSGRQAVAQARRDVVLPAPAVTVPPPPAEAETGVAGVTPWLTPNEDFYRIDTALSVPQVDPASWSLRISGMVGRPFRLSYAELLDLPQEEIHLTIACVSNEVGGGLVGNARWQGVPLADLLDRAGVEPGATQVVGRSVDGFTAGFPTAAALDGRDALVAVAMNGEPLPAAHGFPARLVVAGLYGYVSATKWLTEIELTTLDGFDAYWIPRGWAKEAPIKTQSRIDVPRHGARPRAGRTTVAGVAWAPTRGVAAVEVRVDDGPWGQAQLAAAVGDDTWRQWTFDWDAEPGQHTLAVRATDGTGTVQDERRRPVMPDGATGYHVVRVEVG